MSHWIRHFSSKPPCPHPSQVAPRTYLRPHIQKDIFPACFFGVFITWVERKRKVKECNPETLSCACSDRLANIPPADSWHAIVTCWILFHTARPLVECLAFMSLCVTAVSCCSSRRLCWTCGISLIYKKLHLLWGNGLTQTRYGFSMWGHQQPLTRTWHHRCFAAELPLSVEYVSMCGGWACWCPTKQEWNLAVALFFISFDRLCDFDTQELFPAPPSLQWHCVPLVNDLSL